MHVLDNPVWAALHGSQQAMGTASPLAARFVPAVSRFGAFPEVPGPEHWAALAALATPGTAVATTGCTAEPPPGWTVVYDGAGVQLTGEDVAVEPMSADASVLAADDALVPLGTADAEEMLALVSLAQPGPFEVRTVELGGYVGVRHRGQLVAMAGERMRPPGWAEISAVATHPDHRGRGLAGLLTRQVARGIRARGEVPFLHASVDNAPALRLYAAMGFTRRREVRFLAAASPD